MFGKKSDWALSSQGELAKALYKKGSRKEGERQLREIQKEAYKMKSGSNLLIIEEVEQIMFG